MKPSEVGKFGMIEMEHAAARIVKVLKETNISGIGVNDMLTDAERDGFAELLVRRWLEKRTTYNGSFFPTRAFFERMGGWMPEWAVKKGWL